MIGISFSTETSNYNNDSTTTATFLSDDYDEDETNDETSSILYYENDSYNNPYDGKNNYSYDSEDNFSIISKNRYNSNDCICIDIVNNQIDHKTDLFGKYFVDGFIKFGCNIFNRTIPSSHDDEDRCVDDAIYEEFSRSAIVSKYSSSLFEYDDEDVFRSSSSSNSSIDYNSIIDKMNIDINNDIKMAHVNVSIPLGCKFNKKDTFLYQ